MSDAKQKHIFPFRYSVYFTDKAANKGSIKKRSPKSGNPAVILILDPTISGWDHY